MEKENKQTATIYKGEINGNLLRSYITRIFAGISYGLKANLGGETQLTVTLFGISIKENEEKEKVLKYENKMKLSVFDCLDTVSNGADNRREFGAVICDANDFNYPLISYHRDIETGEWMNDIVKPYLRPMSSMTLEEFQGLRGICAHAIFNQTNNLDWIVGINGSDYGRISRVDEISKFIDWLNVHHFDYSGLIENGLALEAPDGMYNF